MLSVNSSVFRRFPSRYISARLCSNKYVKIGDVKTLKGVAKPNNKVVGFIGNLPDVAPNTVRVLKWIMQKDKLKQDIFLLGTPGDYRRHVVLSWLELVGKEYEYICLTRDTTESDMKQRKEIIQGQSKHIDQCAVRAAIEGKVLILDGIERAERNLLPILNNLLENREMSLEDGTFLIPAGRFHKLVEQYGEDHLKKEMIKSVHENFRVVALGLPNPAFKGNPLDPPFRSRFQCMAIDHLPFNDYAKFSTALGKIPDNWMDVVSFAYSINTEEMKTKYNIPHFPIDSLPITMKVLQNVPGMSPEIALRFIYPDNLLLDEESGKVFQNMLQKFNLSSKDKEGGLSLKKAYDSFMGNSDSKPVQSQLSNLSLKFDKVADSVEVNSEFTVPGYESSVTRTKNGDLILYPKLKETLYNMLSLHSASHFGLIGPRGCGKTALVEHFGRALGYKTSTVMLYKDMPARDMLQTRMTDHKGDTVWAPSAVVKGALEGKLVILDGLHCLPTGSLMTLQTLLRDGDTILADGMRLLSSEKFDLLREQTGLSEKNLHSQNVHRVSSKFRLIGLAEPPSLEEQWLTPEVNALLPFITFPQVTSSDVTQVLTSKFPELSHEIDMLQAFCKTLATSSELKESVPSLRQQLGILGSLQGEDKLDQLKAAIEKNALVQFLPSLKRRAFESALISSGIRDEVGGVVHSGNDVSAALEREISFVSEVRSGFQYSAADHIRIPDVFFHDNVSQARQMLEICKDLRQKRHILLVGAQGVGKNRLIDRLLGLGQWPRQYMQLHRDSTVQSLTLVPTIKNGKIEYLDSPLVQAVTTGHLLVLDEADKAPVHVTRVLKSLLDTGHMNLADGRTIVPHDEKVISENDSSLLRVHPNFQAIFLANKPGYPFLGNDFFGSLGDLFACHAINNPDRDSEAKLLAKYAPDFAKSPDFDKVLDAFAELRKCYDEDSLTYPYSTREIIAIAKHVEAFPNDGILSALKNVLDFDKFDSAASETLEAVFQKHGLPLARQSFTVSLSPTFPLPEAKQMGFLSKPAKGGLSGDPMVFSESKLPPVSATFKAKRRSDDALVFNLKTSTDEKHAIFSEHTTTLGVKLHSDYSTIRSIVSHGDLLHLFSSNPPCVTSLAPNRPTDTAKSWILGQDFFVGKEAVFELVPFPFAPDGNYAVLFDRSRNSLVKLNMDDGRVNVHQLPRGKSSSKSEDGILFARRNPKSEAGFAQFVPAVLDNDNALMTWYTPGQRFPLHFIDWVAGSSFSVEPGLPSSSVILSVSPLSNNSWLVETSAGSDDKRKDILDSSLLRIDFDRSTTTFTSQSIDHSQMSQSSASLLSPHSGLGILKAGKDKPGQFLGTSEDNLLVWGKERRPPLDASGMLSSEVTKTFVDLKAFQRSTDILLSAPENEKTNLIHAYLAKFSQHFAHVGSTFDSASGILVNAHASLEHPRLSGMLEVLHTRLPSSPDHAAVNFVPVFAAQNKRATGAGYLDPVVGIDKISSSDNDKHNFPDIVTVRSSGLIDIWKVAPAAVQASLAEWSRMLGGGTDDKISVEDSLAAPRDNASLSDLNGPKHGQVDPTGAPHMGGNTWAGGSGGRDTAGLGGVGGPYRLDSGNPVTQVSDAAKNAVPEHLRQAAREMAEKTFNDRLKQIKMSKVSAEEFDRFYSQVASEVAILRTMLDQIPSKEKDRVWVRHQIEGDLDDSKLVDGLAGDRNVFRKCVDPDKAESIGHKKPKFVSVVADVSGSMYRFNGYDGRLQRELSSVLMMMAAFSQRKDKVLFELYGHSGESDAIPLIKVAGKKSNESSSSPSKSSSGDEKEDLALAMKHQYDLLMTMVAHSQFCPSGDNTLGALKTAIQRAKNVSASDDKVVILLSDANLRRYGIPAKSISNLMEEGKKGDADIGVFVIFLGSLGNEANDLVKLLPPGRAFVVEDTSKLPHVLKNILSASILN